MSALHVWDDDSIRRGINATLDRVPYIHVAIAWWAGKTRISQASDA